MTDAMDKWVSIRELSTMFGVSQESIGRLAKSRDFPLRRLTPYATPGVLQSELFSWLKAQPRVGQPIRIRTTRKKRK